MDVDSTFVSGVWWRHIPAGGDVLYEPEHPAENRWQRGQVVDAWYFADEPDTVWAEWYRAAAELGVPPQALLPRDLWQWQLSLTNVADLGDRERLGGWGSPCLNRAAHSGRSSRPSARRFTLTTSKPS